MRNEVCCFVSSLFDCLAPKLTQEPLCSLYVHSILHVPPFLLYAIILFSFSIHFVLDPWVSVDCHGFVTAFCSWFDIPSFLAIPLFNSLYGVCIVCYTFNIYLTTLFDVYCMLFWLIHCMCNLPTKCSYTPPSLPIIPICLGWIHQKVHLYLPQILSLGPHFHGVTYVCEAVWILSLLIISRPLQNKI